MRGNRSKDTLAELAVRRALHAKGLRYRVNMRPLPELRRTADVVFTRAKVAVFIDGCFWHACPTHYVEPKVNVDYWRPKIERNRARDLETSGRLEGAGWIVLRFWEHHAPEAVVQEICGVVRATQAPNAPCRMSVPDGAHA